jgi:hypothetical protein
MSLLVLLIVWVAGGTLSYPQPAAPADTSGYVWDLACKECHSEVYDAWAKTKHKTALNRLSAAEQDQPCGACHLTGSVKPVSVDGKIVNAGVQCESCHGPGKDHVDSAKAGAATPTKLGTKPAESLCVQCHNDKSPHFHGFFFAAMKGFVHKAK